MKSPMPLLLPVFVIILSGCQETPPAVSAASPAQQIIVIEGEGLAPESVTSLQDGTIFIGDGVRGILRARAGMAKAERWASLPADGASGIFGVFADEASGTLWVCTASMPEDGAPPGPPSMLHAVDLASGAHRARYPLPTPNAFCNDIAVGADGAAYVTDSNNMEILRLPRSGQTLDFWAGRGAFGPADGVLDGIAVLGDRILVNALGTGELFSVVMGADGAASTITRLTLDRSLDRPDGMRAVGPGQLLLAEYGGGGKLVSIRVAENHGAVETLSSDFHNGTAAVTLTRGVAWVLEYGDESGRQPPRLLGIALPDGS